MIHQHNRADLSVKIIGRRESKPLLDINIKKQNMSLVTDAGITEMMKDTEENIITVSKIFLLQKQYL